MTFIGSADTWRTDRDTTPVVDPRLTARPSSRTGWLRTWRERQQLRADHADREFAAAHAPLRGLPVAHMSAVRRFLADLFRSHPALLALVLVANALAAIANLAMPRMLGGLIDTVAVGGIDAAGVSRFALFMTVVVVALGVLTFLAQWLSAALGQTVLAAARERVIHAVLRLPLGQIEQASAGDLVTRVTRDVSAMSETVRFSLPQVLVAGTMVLLSVVAMIVNSWLLAVPVLVCLVITVLVVRPYFRAAPPAYITENATYSRIDGTLTETTEGARTVEALGLRSRRDALTEGDLAVSAQAERYTLGLRSALFWKMELAQRLPLVVVVLLGGVALHEWVSLGQITAAILYSQMLANPLAQMLMHADRIQVGMAAVTRVLGIAEVPPDRVLGPDLPRGSRLIGEDLRFAYREGHDVLHGVDVDLRPGERLAIVGPSGSGKSTLGRLLSGINGPRTGQVTVGGAELLQLPLPVLRREVALVTQEHHVFQGTVRDNVVLAREGSDDAAVIAALRTVQAWDWVSRFPTGLDTMLGAGNTELTPAQAQQIALARLVLADPHTLVLDEATSLIDPRTARHLEGAMSALLTDRAVVAIAHRLHTAHDADRIAVVMDGRIVELGSHDELLALDGEYASLWRAWTS